ncbi:unnamed protein product [Closterium sp. NIES-64]|nr:unnamed protein product [Closterium sp. NIES-64]
MLDRHSRVHKATLESTQNSPYHVSSYHRWSGAREFSKQSAPSAPFPPCVQFAPYRPSFLSSRSARTGGKGGRPLTGGKEGSRSSFPPLPSDSPHTGLPYFPPIPNLPPVPPLPHFLPVVPFLLLFPEEATPFLILTLHWAATTGSTLRLALQAKAGSVSAKSWFAIGWTPDGQMSGSDAVVRVPSSNTPGRFFLDGYSNVRATTSFTIGSPSTETTSLHGTVMKFSRSSGDGGDVAVNPHGRSRMHDASEVEGTWGWEMNTGMWKWVWAYGRSHMVWVNGWDAWTTSVFRILKEQNGGDA